MKGGLIAFVVVVIFIVQQNTVLGFAFRGIFIKIGLEGDFQLKGSLGSHFFICFVKSCPGIGIGFGGERELRTFGSGFYQSRHPGLEGVFAVGGGHGFGKIPFSNDSSTDSRTGENKDCGYYGIFHSYTLFRFYLRISTCTGRQIPPAAPVSLTRTVSTFSAPNLTSLVASTAKYLL